MMLKSGIWNVLKHALVSNTLPVSQPELLPLDTTNIPDYLIGDDAFGLEEFMMKAQTATETYKVEKDFYYRLSCARWVVENAFRIMSIRFRVLTTTQRHSPEVATLVTCSCCMLHNIIRARYPLMQAPMLGREDQDHNLIPGAWRTDYEMHDINRNIDRNTSKKRAKGQSDLLKLYYSNIGAVPLQNHII